MGRIGPARQAGRRCRRLESVGRLIMLLYLMISVITPLSTVHVEDPISSLSWAAGHGVSGADTVLVRLHEMLFLHFSDRADHIAYPMGHRLEKPLRADRTITSPAACLISPVSLQDDENSAECHATYSSMQDDTPLPFDGFLLFCSNLSPPAA